MLIYISAKIFDIINKKKRNKLSLILDEHKSILGVHLAAIFFSQSMTGSFLKRIMVSYTCSKLRNVHESRLT